MIGLCTYLTGGTDYEDMRLFALERGEMNLFSITQAFRIYRPLFPVEVGDVPPCFFPSITICFSDKPAY